jgi:hypothetical protein
MIFNQKDVIESFIHSFDGPSAIRNRDGLHLLINSKWKSIIGDTQGKLLSELITDSSLKSYLECCKKYDEESISYQEPLYKYENFNGKRYVTIRIPIIYKNQSSILILATPLI